MLKNKKAVYILIPLNLLIWGFFAYRFYSAYTESDAPEVRSNLPSVKVEILKDSVTYKLSMDYKDPFLKDVKNDAPAVHTGAGFASAQPVKTSQVKEKAPPPPPKQVPVIKYLGLIKNTSSGLTAALVSVNNGQSKLIKQNESIDGIVFKSFNKDSLVAKWGKERIVVRK